MIDVLTLAAVAATLHCREEPVACDGGAYYVDAAEACVEQSWGDLGPFRCMSIAYHESRYTPSAVGRLMPSGNRAKGMLQVVVSHARTKTSGYTPKDVHTFEGSVFYAASAYNNWAQEKGSAKALCHYAGGNVCAGRYARRVVRYENRMRKLYNETLPLTYVSEFSCGRLW